MRLQVLRLPQRHWLADVVAAGMAGAVVAAVVGTLDVVVVVVVGGGEIGVVVVGGVVEGVAIVGFYGRGGNPCIVDA